MQLFAKNITTVKSDPLTEFKAIVAAVIQDAIKAGVPKGDIFREFESHAANYRLAEAARIEAWGRNPNPTMYDPISYAPIDAHAMAAKAETERHERELKAQQKSYQEALRRRSNA